MSKFCFKCGAQLKDSAKFCNKCGEPVKAQTLPTEQRCAECGAQLKATSKFCPACGKESDNEALGGNTADVIYGFFQDRFGLKVSQVLNTLANPMDISIRKT